MARLPKTESGARPMAAGQAIIAAVVAVVLVAGANLAGALDDTGGGGDASSFDFGASTTAPPVVTTQPGGAPDTTGPAGVPDTAGTGISPPASGGSVAGHVPTPADPAVVYIAGDSDAGNLGPPLASILADTKVVESHLRYKVSSGLTNPKFFDWPKQLEADMAAFNPDIVVVTFGGNDAQNILVDGTSYAVDTPEWRAEYGRRVGAVMDYLTSNGRSLVWVGIPNAKKGTFLARLDVLQQVTKEQAAARAGKVDYVDTWNRFVGASGGYADYIIDPRDGQGKLVRHDDGFHLNTVGAEILALDVARVVVDELIARGAAIQPVA